MEIVSERSRRSHVQACRAVFIALVGSGLTRFTQDSGQGGWDFENLPFGGRLKVTTARNEEVRRRLLRWTNDHAERRHWGASVFFNRYLGSGFSVQMSLEDFSLLMGRLAEWETERRRMGM